MSPAGRPPLAGSRKNERIEVRFTDAEKQRVTSAAEIAGQPVATWARDALLASAEHVIATAAKKPAKKKSP